MSVPGGVSPTPITEWWEDASLEEVAGSTKVVEDFIITDTGLVAEAQFLKALPLMIMCGGDDPAWLADYIAKRTNGVREKAKATPKDEAVQILEKRIRQLTLLGDALGHLPDSFKRDPKDLTADLYKDGNVSSVYEAVQSGIADCRRAIQEQGPGLKIRLRRGPPGDS